MEEHEWERVFLSEAVTFDMCRVTDSGLSSCQTHPSSGSLVVWWITPRPCASHSEMHVPKKLDAHLAMLTKGVLGQVLQHCPSWTTSCTSEVMVWLKRPACHLCDTWCPQITWVIGLNKAKTLVEKTAQVMLMVWLLRYFNCKQPIVGSTASGPILPEA